MRYLDRSVFQIGTVIYFFDATQRGPERAVSVHTTLKTAKQSSYSREAINSRMYIALNGEGTALFNPRPAVAKFLEI
jgi:hypothetical protein